MRSLLLWLLLTALASALTALFLGPEATALILTVGLLAIIAVPIGRRTDRRIRILVGCSALLLVLPVRYTLGAVLVHELYLTGNWGEPPGNRYVTVRSVVPLYGGRLAWLFEYGSKWIPTDGVRADVSFDQPYRDDDGVNDGWFGPPGLTDAPPFAERDHPSRHNPIECPTTFGRKIQVRSVTPDTSHYLYVESDAPLAVVDCTFRDYLAESGFDCFDGSIDLTGIERGKQLRPS